MAPAKYIMGRKYEKFTVFWNANMRTMNIKSAVMAPNPILAPSERDFMDLSIMSEFIGPGGAAIDSPRNIPRGTII